MKVTLTTKSTVTTVKVDGKLFHVYIYENNMFTDVIVRNTKGHLVDETHPHYDMIVDEALAFNAL